MYIYILCICIYIHKLATKNVKTPYWNDPGVGYGDPTWGTILDPENWSGLLSYRPFFFGKKNASHSQIATRSTLW
jgi:hypothetical protein